jgi:predicted HicB family RNase H-like nuclease
MARSKTIYSATLYVYVTPEHNKYLRNVAEKNGKSLSEYVDNLIAKDQAKKKVRNASSSRRAA